VAAALGYGETEIMLIEFTGIVGSGKSSLAEKLKEFSESEREEILSSSEAAERVAGRTASGIIIKTLLPIKTLQRKALRRVFAVTTAPWARGAFKNSHAVLIRHVLETSPARRVLPNLHWKIIYKLFLEAGGRTELFMNRLKTGESAVMDEGLVHRAINLYAWETETLDEPSVRAYFRALPGVGPVIIAQCDLETALQRARQRGLPQRLRDKDESVVMRFMENSTRIVEIAAEDLVTRRQVYIIDNSGSISDSQARLKETAAVIWGKPVEAQLELQAVDAALIQK